MTIKDKNKKEEEKKSPFVVDFGCISRYGPHLMIVMIFVAQNNF